jgi:hypothetical protein
MMEKVDLSTMRRFTMENDRLLRPLEKAFRGYALVLLVVLMTQLLGLGMYLFNVWPAMQGTSPSGVPIKTQALVITALAVVAGFVRSAVWVAIYWQGSRVFRLLRTDGGDPTLAGRVLPVLRNLTLLLVTSCVLDVLFLPAYFASDAFLPFSVSGWRLGVVEVARVLFPQVFGIGALILAYLTHQYGRLLAERGRLQSELELTI